MDSVADRPASPRPARVDLPYVGLSYYTEAQAEVFFGRDAERSVIIGNLRAARLTVLYARSGVGKSSLLRAGVAARLRETARRSADARERTQYIPVVFSSWRDEPVDEFIDELVRALASYGVDHGAELPRESLDAALEAAATSTDATLLVILDQFEEYFLYGPSEEQPGRFANELARCLNRPDLPVNFLIAVREDAYAGVGDLFRGKVANPYGNSLSLDYLDREAARSAIVKPVQYYNAQHPDEQPIQLEPELVEGVLEQVRTGQVTFDEQGVGGVSAADGAGPAHERIETPYLQLVLLALWERERGAGSRVLRKSTLDELGGATAIVRSHLDRAMESLSDDERETATEVFNHLVTPSGTKIVHTVADLAQYSGRDQAQVRTLIEKLSGDKRILRPVPPVPGDDSPRVEIFHDVLAPAILAWRTGQTAARLERERRAAERRADAERRRARTFRALAAIAFTLLVVAVVAVFLARAETTRAHRAEHLALSRQLAQQASSDLADGALGRGVLLALEAYTLSRTDAARVSLVRALAATAPMSAYLGGHTGNVTSVAYSPTGKLLASGGAEGTVLLQDATTGKTVSTLRGNGAPLEAVSFSSDRRFVAAGGLGRGLFLWSLAHRLRRRMLSVNQDIYGLAFGPQDATLAAGGTGGTVTLFDTGTGRAVRTFGRHGPAASAMAFSPDGRTLAIAAGTRVVLWNVRTGAPVRTMDGNQGTVNDVAFAPDGGTIVSAGEKGTAVVWNAVSGQRVLTLRGHSGAVNSVAFSPDGRTLASAGSDHKVILWSASTGARRQTFQGHSAAVEAVAFSPDGRSLASGADDDQVIVWSSSPSLLERDLGVGGQPLAVAANPSGTLLATGSLDGTLAIWNARTGQRVRALRGHTGAVETVAFSPDGHTVAAGSDDHTVILWNAETGARERTLRGHTDIVYSVAFSPDGRWLASGSADQTVILWNGKTGARERTLPGHTDFVYGVAFSPDSKTLASASADRTVIVSDVASGKTLRTLTGHTGAVESVAFSPSQNALASAGNDGQVILWDPRTGRRLGAPVQTGSASVLSVAFDPRRPILASGGGDQTVTLWDLRSRLGYPLYGHTAAVESIAFLQAGRAVASASPDGSVQEDGPVPPGIDFTLVSRRLCGVVRRNLTISEWNQYVPGQPYREICAGQ